MTTTDPVIPSAPQAELSLLGAMLLSADAIDAALTIIGPEDFNNPAHGHVMAAIEHLHLQGDPVDAITVATELEGRGLLEEIGGGAFLLDAQAATPAISNARHYARDVAEKAQQRRLQALGAQLYADPTRDVLDALADLEELEATARHPARLTLTPASTVTMDRAHWIWEKRIPVGGPTLMPGPEGVGKTMLTAHIAARLTHGQLAGERKGRPSDVVYIGLEDDRETVLVPRLVAAGADLDRILFVDLPPGQTFTLNGEALRLERALRDLDVGLIVIDPLDSHLGSTVDTHKKGEVQMAIGHLTRLCQEHRCGALGLAHLNKAATVTDYLTKVIGSKGFTTAVRSVLAVGEHPQNDKELVCVLAKANMTGKLEVPGIRFKIERAQVPHPDEDDDIDTARVVILGEEAGLSAAALLGPRDTDEDRSALDEATDWLESMLQTGKMSKAEVVRFAKTEGITLRTLERACEVLGVVSERDQAARGRPTSWRLPTTGEDYPPTITRQMSLADNQHGSDQGEQPAEGGFPPNGNGGGKYAPTGGQP